MINTPTTIARKSIFIFTLVSLSVLFFAPSVTSSFSSDDYRHLERNIYFKDAINALNVFVEFDGREYRPIVRYSLWLNYQFARNAIPFKITNMLFHTGCVILLYFIMLNILNNKTNSFLGALIFCVLPIHSASVNFIMGRTDIFCAFFYLSSLLFLLKSAKSQNKTKKAYYVISVVFFLFSIASKEMAVTLPAMASIILWLSYSKGEKNRNSRNIIQKTSIFWAIAIGYVILRVIYWSTNPESMEIYTNYNLAHIVKNYFFWLFAMIYPTDLYLARYYMEHHATIFFVIAFSTTFVIFFILRYITNFRRIMDIVQNKMILLGAIWFVTTLLPIMAGNAHRWYLYLPSISLSFVLIGILKLTQEQRKKIFFTFTSILLLFYIVELSSRTYNWRVQDSFSKDFLIQIENANVFQEKEIYLINTPFGYRNSYLFTWNSLAYAISIFTNIKLKIHNVSFINLSDRRPLSYKKINSKVVVSLEPNHYNYFLFNNIQRHFSEKDEIRVEDLLIRVLKVDSSGLVEKYELFLPRENQIPILFFDGNKLIKL